MAVIEDEHANPRFKCACPLPKIMHFNDLIWNNAKYIHFKLYKQTKLEWPDGDIH